VTWRRGGEFPAPADARTIRPTRPDDAYVRAAALAADGTAVLVGYSDGRIEAFGPDGEAEPRIGEPSGGGIVSLAALPDGRVAFVTGGPDGVRLSELAEDRLWPREGAFGGEE
jgi:hypothetical protein